MDPRCTRVLGWGKGGCVNLIAAKRTNKPCLLQAIFILSQSKDVPKSCSSPEILFHAVEGIPAWGQGVKTSVVTRVFVLGYSVLLSKCVSQLLSAAGALVQLST